MEESNTTNEPFPNNEILEISYQDFLAVLEAWDEYALVLFEELSRQLGKEMNERNYHNQFSYPEHNFPNMLSVEIKNLSDLAEVFWKSLKDDPKEVERIHDEFFVNTQVEYFKNKFSSAKKLVGEYDYWVNEENCYNYKMPNPMIIFVKLGKPAQLIIIEEGFLEIASSNYEQAKQIKFRKEYEEEMNVRKHKEEMKIISGIEKKVRELDKKQCAYCGREYKYASFQYSKINDKEFAEDNVLLACNKCFKETKKSKLNPKYGRFGKQ